ncbi:MAG: glycoside hydrolase family 127 protein [Opitutaceae bacterium]|jgi:hypothetical protein|nr:glycoside hydrolase family 127 protein [Opitutaceae bacterium]
MTAPAIQPVAFTRVRLRGGVLGRRQQINREVTVPFALQQCEDSLRLKNFDLAAETMRRRAAGETSFQTKPPTEFPFDDTDVYKCIEGASYCLSLAPDPALVAQLEDMIARVAAAQEPDGYLYTWRTMHPDSPAHGWVGPARWVQERDSHETYNLGHLFEAGVAHALATGSRSLIDVCLRAAENLHREFGDEQKPLSPGHPLIEMALARLHAFTGDARWIQLARFCLESRGRTPDGIAYNQEHLPVLQQHEAVGHAVRANYLYSGIADVAAATGSTAHIRLITGLWENVVGRKLHLTGGCGARTELESYGDDYELPHACYNETCAAIAFLYWSHRMFLLTGQGRYMDVFERTLYNGTLSGVSLTGDRFFYPNTLEYDGITKNNHGHAGRAPWFGCACCPPNLMRLLASLGGYVAAAGPDDLWLNLYASAEITTATSAGPVALAVDTDYPWTGDITVRVNPATPSDFTLRLRLPGWNTGRPLPTDLYSYFNDEPAAWSLWLNDAPLHPEQENGYLKITRRWSAGDTLRLSLDMPVRRVTGHPAIASTAGQIALERGPVVYAFEGADHAGYVATLTLPDTASCRPVHRPDFLGGATVLEITDDSPSFSAAATATPSVAIPYALWANRGPSPMRVWLPRCSRL